MEIVKKYFPAITNARLDALLRLIELHKWWNDKINVVSRKDIDYLTERHILHSLAIARFIQFKPGTEILDAGTGGGFPGLPLAIFFPECKFLLVDSIGKKINVVNQILKTLNLKNVETRNARVEELNTRFDFVASRAVTAFPRFVSLVSGNISKKSLNSLPNGIIYLKGGDVGHEIRDYSKSIQIVEIKNYFEEDFFATKKILYLPIGN